MTKTVSIADPSHQRPMHWVRADRPPPLQPRGFNTTHDGVNGAEQRRPALARANGNYDVLAEHPLARATRFRDVLRHDGNIVSQPLTNGTGGLGLGTDDNFRAFQVAKGRYFGWIPLSECPIRGLVAGRVLGAHLVSPEMRSIVEMLVAESAVEDPDERATRYAQFVAQHACKAGTFDEHGCVHLVAERDARRAIQARKAAGLEEIHADKAAPAIAKAAAEGIAAQLGPVLAALAERPKRRP